MECNRWDAFPCCSFDKPTYIEGCQISAQVICVGAPKRCFQPSMPSGAMLSNPGNKKWWGNGTTAIFMCEQGYKPAGTDNLICSSGMWSKSGPEFMCVTHSCGSVSEARGLIVTYQDDRKDWGATSKLECDSGWKGLHGVTEGILHCEDNGWRGARPSCYREHCDSAPLVKKCSLSFWNVGFFIFRSWILNRLC